MKYAALIGNPVEHSVAPYLHEYLARMHHIEFRYLKIKVAEGQVHSTLASLKQLGFCGCNVTLPYKEEVKGYVGTLDNAAKGSGAVNTIVLHSDGAVGRNTDWIGVEQGLIAAGLVVGPDDRAVVLGSGGAARAAIYALKQLGFETVEVFHVTPADEKTQRLSAESPTGGFTMHTYDEVVGGIDRAKVVCNMTSTGMAGQDSTPFDLTRLDTISLSGKYFFDAVFNPVNTPFLKYAGDNGAVIVDGIWMMIYQGIPAFAAWTGEEVHLQKAQLRELHSMLVHEVGAH
ncbi:shikimate dehydrogenase [Rhodococcus sp. IEGM 1330]|uniref:shikimate dehydrogenase family protein n=1 Tax=Rhodococcus sp. IEGM 1330 TaxID=3082225 RepID=UPI002954C5C6|nr:shikimate dehydrogenase [Rhodococcus sp. IEGM 1330]MDV8022202.1 shikimate dehydrogenase [Rhodococcus sp. IEGM 1330]